MDNQSRYFTMDHRDTQTLLWAQNEVVTMWKSLFGRLRWRKSNEGSLHMSLCFLYILCSSNKTRDKHTTDLNGLKCLKEDFIFFFYLIGCAHQMLYLATPRCLIRKLTSVQDTTEVRLAAVGSAISSLNLTDHWSNRILQVSGWPAGSMCADWEESCVCRCQSRLDVPSDSGHFKLHSCYKLWRAR